MIIEVLFGSWELIRKQVGKLPLTELFCLGQVLI